MNKTRGVAREFRRGDNIHPGDDENIANDRLRRDNKTVPTSLYMSMQ